MQLFVRCGAAVGTVALECSAEDTVGRLKELLCAKDAQLGPCRFLRLQHAGASLPDERILSDVAGLEPCATLHATYRLRGGGGDGGSTGAESRSCYLEMYLGKKVEKVNPEEERLARWTRCHLSNEPLSPPCVVDELGSLYNKDALIQRLLDKTLPPTLSHITGLRSVTEVKLHRAATSSAPKAAASQTSFQPSNDSDFACPISGAALNGRYKFVVLRPSGLVVSEKAVKEVPAAVEELAGRKVAECDPLPINPTGEELDRLRARLMARAAEKADKAASKKDKKRSAAAAAATAGAAADGPAAADGAAKRRSASPTPEDVAGQAAAAVGKGSGAGAGPSKRLKLPEGATKEVYSSLFRTSKPGEMEKETFCCRALSARGMNLT
ncbi:hypothetical protein HYH03_008353 [Edaphochlamys debaryana]|uniref:Ubiquitin-like domain-containing protein n=1 Tax=Edaphochlamys debaryana TaxID=47281 RepID=A0A836BZM2_9CHLO|nr:hypothetical protein HYH03_008353 [Edaphochlamys debaryana]|eukprot:KAG2493539.1 hypothetical protein HYH03_008353 [Edaphochlamys debaryana]